MRFPHAVDLTATTVRSAGFTRVALFGMKPVLATDDRQRRDAERLGVGSVVPSPADQDLVDRIIGDELCPVRFPAESKAHYFAAVDDLAARGARGEIVGCTEIPLLIGQADRSAVPVFDTGASHVDAAVSLALARPGASGKAAGIGRLVRN